MIAHGSRPRYRMGCRCVACSRSNYRREDRPTELRWPIRFILSQFDEELVVDSIKKSVKEIKLDDWTQPNNIVRYFREHGFSDYDADRLAIELGTHPMAVWPGWIDAGLDDDR